MNKYTISQFRNDYPNEDACLHKIFELRFTGPICPMCESDNEFLKELRIAGRINVLIAPIKYILLKILYLKKLLHL